MPLERLDNCLIFPFSVQLISRNFQFLRCKRTRQAKILFFEARCRCLQQRRIWHSKLIFRVIDFHFAVCVRANAMSHPFVTVFFSLNAEVKSTLLFMHHRNMSERAFPKLICPKIFATNIAWISNDFRCFIPLFLSHSRLLQYCQSCAYCECCHLREGNTLLNLWNISWKKKQSVDENRECNAPSSNVPNLLNVNVISSLLMILMMRDFGVKRVKNTFSISICRSIA